LTLHRTKVYLTFPVKVKINGHFCPLLMTNQVPLPLEYASSLLHMEIDYTLPVYTLDCNAYNHHTLAFATSFYSFKNSFLYL